MPHPPMVAQRATASSAIASASPARPWARRSVDSVAWTPGRSSGGAIPSAISSSCSALVRSPARRSTSPSTQRPRYSSSGMCSACPCSLSWAASARAWSSAPVSAYSQGQAEPPQRARGAEPGVGGGDVLEDAPAWFERAEEPQVHPAKHLHVQEHALAADRVEDRLDRV